MLEFEAKFRPELNEDNKPSRIKKRSNPDRLFYRESDLLLFPNTPQEFIRTIQLLGLNRSRKRKSVSLELSAQIPPSNSETNPDSSNQSTNNRKLYGSNERKMFEIVKEVSKRMRKNRKRRRMKESEEMGEELPPIKLRKYRNRHRKNCANKFERRRRKRMRRLRKQRFLRLINSIHAITTTDQETETESICSRFDEESIISSNGTFHGDDLPEEGINEEHYHDDATDFIEDLINCSDDEISTNKSEDQNSISSDTLNNEVSDDEKDKEEENELDKEEEKMEIADDNNKENHFEAVVNSNEDSNTSSSRDDEISINQSEDQDSMSNEPLYNEVADDDEEEEEEMEVAANKASKVPTKPLTKTTLQELQNVIQTSFPLINYFERERQISLSESSEDSFIVFGGDDGDSINNSNEEERVEELTAEEDEDEDDEEEGAAYMFVDSDNDTVQFNYDSDDDIINPRPSGSQSMNRNENNRAKKNRRRPKKKVRFESDDRLYEIHPMIAWSYAYSAARRGTWHLYEVDRMRFRRRIDCTRNVLDKILNKKHRDKIYQERFNNY